MDEDRDTQYFIHVSYVEIYNEEIRDLLSDNPERKLEIKGNAVQGTTNMAYNKTLWRKFMKSEKNLENQNELERRVIFKVIKMVFNLMNFQFFTIVLFIHFLRLGADLGTQRFHIMNYIPTTHLRKLRKIR